MNRVSVLVLAFLSIQVPRSWAFECDNWKTNHPEWIWCDDFESDRLGGYFEVSGSVSRDAAVGISGSFGVTSTFTQGESDGGSLKVAFGLTPGFRQPLGVDSTTKFREIYYRAFLRSQTGWINPPAGSNSKMMRATVFSSNDWSQAMISHIWSAQNDNSVLGSDPASCVTGGAVSCVGYNDFLHLQWLGFKPGAFKIFSSSNSNVWNCVESHVRLNDSGLSNGVAEFWIDENLQARGADLNFVGTYSAFGINAVFFENWINNGSPRTQSRYWDNLVISSKPIGCSVSGGARLRAPRNLRVD